MPFSLDDLQLFQPLANLPTPVEETPLFSQHHDVTLHLKRDDTAAGLMGGTKLRALEHIVHRALETGITDLITIGEGTSTQCRMVAALGRRFGLGVHLLIRKTSADGPSAADNVLLMDLLGARITLLDESAWRLHPLTTRRLAGRLITRGRRPWSIPFGCVGDPGTLGILRLMRELHEQHGGALPYTHIVTPTGSGGTLFGMDLAFQALPELATPSPPKLVGCSLHGSADEVTQAIDRHYAEWNRAQSADAARTDRVVVDDRCARLDPEARAQGLVDIIGDLGEIVDPLYVLPAVLGMQARIEEGSIPAGASILFLVTGPCLHQRSYGEELGRAMADARRANGSFTPPMDTAG